MGEYFPFGGESDDTSQPTDVEPDDASPVVSQASAMADAHQSVVIISSVASTISVFLSLLDRRHSLLHIFVGHVIVPFDVLFFFNHVHNNCLIVIT